MVSGVRVSVVGGGGGGAPRAACCAMSAPENNKLRVPDPMRRAYLIFSCSSERTDLYTSLVAVVFCLKVEVIRMNVETTQAMDCAGVDTQNAFTEWP